MKQLISNFDPESVPIYMPEISDSGWTGLVAADTDISVAVPSDARFAFADASSNFFVSATAITLPSVGVVTQTDAQLNTKQIKINGETELHIRGRQQMDFSISFYR